MAEANAEAVLKMQGAHPGPDPSPRGEAGGCTPGQELAIVEALSRNPNVEYAEPNYIAHATDTDANDVIIRVYDRDGNMICRRKRSIPANHSLRLNFKALSELGPDFTDTVYVTSDQNLVGVMDILWSQQQRVSYNAFSQQ